MIADLQVSLRALATSLSRRSLLLTLALGLALAIPLGFVAYTHLVWEDFFITYRYSENLARGHGLVYAAGERVHGFTSPLDALLPALACAVLRARDFVGPLWFLRLVSLAGLGLAFVAAASGLHRDAAPSALRRAAACLFPLCAALEIKTTAFAMSGQEAGLVLGFLAPAFILAVLGWSRHWLLGGMLWAGLMYSRPDAFIYIGALALAALAFGPDSRRLAWRALIKSSLICAALYLPWVLFTWAYYGSPIPHTVTAKVGLTGFAVPGFHLVETLAAGLSQAPWILCSALAPIYDRLGNGPGPWPAWIHDASFLLQLLAVVYWAIPTRDRLGRMASLFSLLLLGYLGYVTLSSQLCPWYYPPLAFMSLLTLASAFVTLGEALRQKYLGYGCAGAAFAGLLFLLGFIFVSSLEPLRIKQEVIEWNHRRQIGLWLKAHVRPGDAVYLEPLGYIGYFSEAKMLDWPGLVSPTVTAARRQLGPMTPDNWSRVAEVLKPAWIVARPESVELMRHNKFLAGHYRLEQAFDATGQIQKLGLPAATPGLYLIYADAVFGVFRRID